MNSESRIHDLVSNNAVLGSKSPNETIVQLIDSERHVSSHTIVNTRNDRVSDPQDLVNLARQIEACDVFVRANVSNRLQVISNQMSYLREEAQRTLMKAHRDDELNHCACNLVRRPGQTYYQYERQTGQKYLSIMHPQDWLPNSRSGRCPHRFFGCI